MAAISGVDGLLLSFNNAFLISLHRERYNLTRLRFKFINESNRVTYRTFETHAAFNAHFSVLLANPNIGCSTGNYPILESILLNNEKLNFANDYYARNIPDGANIQRQWKFDSYRKDRQKEAVDKYHSYLTSKFIKYMTDINNLIAYRNEMYIEECYIAESYFSTPPIPLVSL